MTENKGHFKKGQSGNPNGRPRKTMEQAFLEQRCKEHTEEALDEILLIMKRGENERNRLSAAQYVIDRGWGKATQAVQLSGQGGEDLNITVNFVDAVKQNG
jgi:hypothetical protein